MSESRKDYYKILEIGRSADAQTIKAAYKKMSLKFHPDKNLDNVEAAERIFKEEILPAYEVLSDPSKKHVYDNPNSVFGNKFDPDPTQGNEGYVFIVMTRYCIKNRFSKTFTTSWLRNGAHSIHSNLECYCSKEILTLLINDINWIKSSAYTSIWGSAFQTYSKAQVFIKEQDVPGNNVLFIVRKHPKILVSDICWLQVNKRTIKNIAYVERSSELEDKSELNAGEVNKQVLEKTDNEGYEKARLKI